MKERKVSFNPRARVGRDAAFLTGYGFAVVSIHAPAWGATLLGGLRGRIVYSFNPRARVGRDVTSTGAGNRRAECFNPRARVGRDRLGAGARRYHQAVSIHAPAWGATCVHGQAPCDRASFNPRARVGRDTV